MNPCCPFAEYDETTAEIKASGISTKTLREDTALAIAYSTELEFYEQARRALNEDLSQNAASRSSDSACRDGQGQQGEAQRGSGEDCIAPVGESSSEGLTAPPAPT